MKIESREGLYLHILLRITVTTSTWTFSEGRAFVSHICWLNISDTTIKYANESSNENGDMLIIYIFLLHEDAQVPFPKKPEFLQNQHPQCAPAV